MAADHPLLAGPLPLWSPQIRETLAQYDCLLVCGMNLFRLYIHFEPDFPLDSATRIVQLDCAVAELGKNTAPDATIWGPIRQGLEALEEQLQQQTLAEGRATVDQRRARIAARLAGERQELRCQFEQQATDSV